MKFDLAKWAGYTRKGTTVVHGNIKFADNASL
jgi:hypothetical protein